MFCEHINWCKVENAMTRTLSWMMEKWFVRLRHSVMSLTVEQDLIILQWCVLKLSCDVDGVEMWLDVETTTPFLKEQNFTWNIRVPNVGNWTSSIVTFNIFRSTPSLKNDQKHKSNNWYQKICVAKRLRRGFE